MSATQTKRNHASAFEEEELGDHEDPPPQKKVMIEDIAAQGGSNFFEVLLIDIEIQNQLHAEVSSWI